METIIVMGVLTFIGFQIWKKKRKHFLDEQINSLMKYSLELKQQKHAEIISQGITYVPDDLEGGVFQMKDFPYGSYEEWNKVYRRAASQANPALEIKIGDDGSEYSLLDFLDDEPTRRAYAHHLCPEKLGRKTGEVFDIRDVSFEDGVTTGEFIDSLIKRPS